jgi:predicted transcriptional regulator
VPAREPRRRALEPQDAWPHGTAAWPRGEPLAQARCPRPIDGRFFCYPRPVSQSKSLLLGELEQAVMDHLWSCGCSDVNEVQQHVGRARGIRSNTVQSTLRRLYDKGLLERRKVSHAYVYEPVCSREVWQRDTLDQVVDSLMAGETDSMLAAFVDLAERAGPEHLARLERLVAKRREQD